eukprot:TRINITY_DN111335_c0_g1_i1.p1 TRINITY_DN111335_c0_g1~~TRINITY_DN111335_c0_g1_i1.p1  ORF type:complete len:190 (-),score=22.90 TRINITY_DN111335_c0_g1_i1:107-676(-)
MRWRLSQVAQVAACAAGSAAAMKCPGSSAWVHASCEVTAMANATCQEVATEITLRASGQGGWIDPNDAGIYTVLSSSSTEIQTQRITNPARSVGGQVYIDKQTITLTGTEDGCKVEGCSESQGTSIGDRSTNYCNLRNLYCGPEDGCKHVGEPFKVVETWILPSMGAGRDKTECSTGRPPSDNGHNFFP